MIDLLDRRSRGHTVDQHVSSLTNSGSAARSWSARIPGAEIVHRDSETRADEARKRAREDPSSRRAGPFGDLENDPTGEGVERLG